MLFCSDTETLIHLLKGSLGSGILSMPYAFMNAGLWFGLISTFIVGAICTYCVHVLVKCAHIVYRRMKVPSLTFGEVAKASFMAGPPAVQKYARLARFIINTFLVLDLIACCCVYNVFVGASIKQVLDHYCGVEVSIRLCIFALLPFLILINLIRNLKHMAPLSFIANIFMGTGMIVTIYYIVKDLPPVTERPFIGHPEKIPIFFGSVIFALEGIGVVMSLENNMKTPQNFIGCPGVLNTGMLVVIALYSLIGFGGYWKYGNDTQGSNTLNLPVEEV